MRGNNFLMTALNQRKPVKSMGPDGMKSNSVIKSNGHSRNLLKRKVFKNLCHNGHNIY